MSVQERVIITDIDGDQVDVTDLTPLNIAGITAPRSSGATNANVSFVVQDGVRREAWIDHGFIQQNKISAGFTLWVRDIVNVGDAETHWENQDGDMIAHKNPKQRIRFNRSFAIEPVTGGDNSPFSKFKG